MILSFSFSNFKSVKEEVVLSFEATKSHELEDYYVVQATPKLRILKVVALYGANASGKSNILEALNFIRLLVTDPAKNKTEPIVYDRFAFDKDTKQGNSSFNLRFVTNETLFDYKLVLNPTAIIEESLHYHQPNRALIYSRSTDLNNRLSKIEFGSKIRVTSEDRHALESNTLWNNTVLGGFLKVNIELPEVLIAADWFGTVLSDLVTPSRDLLSFVTTRIHNGEIDKSNVIKILQKADFNIVDIDIENTKLKSADLLKLQAQLVFNDKTLRQVLDQGTFVNVQLGFKHSVSDGNNEISESLPYEKQSLGTQRFYQLAGVLDLLMRHSKIAVFDEIESSLHPDLLKYFVLLFLRNTRHSQLLFTTHQRDFLQETDMLRHDVIYFTEKNEDGSTELYAMSDFNTSVIRRDSSLYKAYKTGRLGGVPELEDAYIPMD